MEEIDKEIQKRIRGWNEKYVTAWQCPECGRERKTIPMEILSYHNTTPVCPNDGEDMEWVSGGYLGSLSEEERREQLGR